MTEHRFLKNLNLYKPIFAQGWLINVEELLNTHFGFEHVPLRNERGEQIAPSVGNDLTRRHPQKGWKLPSNAKKQKPKARHEHPLKKSDVTFFNGASIWILKMELNGQLDVVVEAGNALMMRSKVSYLLILKRPQS